MSLDPFRAAIARVLHITPADPMTTDQIKTLTDNLTAAKAQVEQLASDKASLASQLVSETQTAATAVAAQHNAESQLADATAKLAALPDPTAIDAMASAAQGLLDAVAAAKAAGDTAPAAA